MRILHWFRKDLRLDDNTALTAAARDASGDVVPFYASEPEILGRDDIAAVRVRFALESLADLAAAVGRTGSRLALAHGRAVETVVAAAKAARADAVYWNDEYEPALIARDAAVERALGEAGVAVRRFHDRLLVAPGAVRTGEGRPFSVYSPFRRACEALPLDPPLPRVTRLAPHDLPCPELATLERLGFRCDLPPWPGGATAAAARLRAFVAGSLRGYATNRDRLDLDATSNLSVDLKFGTISPRTIVAAVAAAGRERRGPANDAEKFVSELRWRDFYAHVMFHFPHSERGAFRREYDRIAWRGEPEHLDAWREGRTGFPVVDAAMRQLAATGRMHNRARMIVASFLTKDLLLDWRHGERHFMRHLVDGDLASNNGGWQWAASTGTDPQPYFRIFNPWLQGARFDPRGDYVRRWVPELARMPARWIHDPAAAPPAELAAAGVAPGTTYPLPIVDHARQRERAIAAYREVAR
jgi:deoxyribodipyrimidine photo-lyase